MRDSLFAVFVFDNAEVVRDSPLSGIQAKMEARNAGSRTDSNEVPQVESIVPWPVRLLIGVGIPFAVYGLGCIPVFIWNYERLMSRPGHHFAGGPELMAIFMALAYVPVLCVTLLLAWRVRRSKRSLLVSGIAVPLSVLAFYCVSLLTAD